MNKDVLSSLGRLGLQHRTGKELGTSYLSGHVLYVSIDEYPLLMVEAAEDSVKVPHKSGLLYALTVYCAVTGVLTDLHELYHKQRFGVQFSLVPPYKGRGWVRSV